MSGNSNFPGSLNGKVNGVPAGLLPGTFPGQGLRNMTPGAAINALLMNKKNGNVGNSTVLTNGLVSVVVFFVMEIFDRLGVVSVVCLID